MHEAVIGKLIKSEGSDSSLRSCKDQFVSFPAKCFKVLQLPSPLIIERLDRKLADVIDSNIVEKRDVTLSRAIQPLDFFKVVRMVFWSGVVGPGTNVELSLARASRSALVRSRLKARLVSKSTTMMKPVNAILKHEPAHVRNQPT